MTTVSPATNSLQNPTAQNVANQQIPSEGPRCLAFAFDFTTLTRYDVNLQNFMQRGQMSIIQGAFIDNLASPNPLIISNQATGQNIQCPPYSQGYFPLFAIQPCIFIVSTSGAGSGVVPVFFYNVPIAPATWGAVSPVSMGTYLVQDVALEGALIGNTLGTTAFAYSGGDLVRPVFKADTHKVSTVSTTATTTLLTGSPGFFVSFIDVSISGDATISVPGEQILTLEDDSANLIWQKTIWLSSTQIAGFTSAQLAQIPDIDWNSKVSGGKLLFVQSPALVTGKISLNLGTGLTSRIT